MPADPYLARLLTGRRLLGLLLLLLVAIGLRVANLQSEPLWYDEAGSVQVSEGTFRQVLLASANDSTPPLYFLGLSAWRKMSGNADAVFRAYSVIWSLAGLLLLFGFAYRAVGWRPALAAAALQAVNPIDVYFAGEVRMYAQAAALSTATAWLLWEQLREPLPLRRRHCLAALYALASLALLQTHYVAIAILGTAALVATIHWARRRQWLQLAVYTGWCLAAALLFVGWYAFLVHLRGGFNAANFSWMTHPPPTYFINFLWHEFFWGRNALAQTRYWALSLALILVLTAVVGRGLFRGRGAPILRYPVLLLLGCPLAAGLLGCLYQPIYNRERFATFLAPFFALTVAASLARLPNRALRRGLFIALAGTMLFGSLWQSQAVRRTDWVAFASLWHQSPPAAVVFFPAFHRVPAKHYLPQALKARSPKHIHDQLSSLDGKIIWTVASRGYTFSANPAERESYQQLHALGSSRQIAFASDLDITEIRIGRPAVPAEFSRRFDSWFEPREQPGRVEGLDRPEFFHAMEAGDQGQPVRWSKGEARLKLFPDDSATTVTLMFSWPPQSTNCRAQFHSLRSTAPDPDLFATPAAQVLTSSATPAPQEVDLPIAPGPGPVLIGWRTDTVNLKNAGISPDPRDLGLLLHWIAVSRSPQDSQQ